MGPALRLRGDFWRFSRIGIRVKDGFVLEVHDYMQGESRLMIPFWFLFFRRSMYKVCNQSTAR
jgi:hypothetical protein